MIGKGKIERLDRAGFILGVLEYDERPGKVLEVHLDVIPSHQRQGIGRWLIKQAEKLAESDQFVSLATFMAADNEQAKGFFPALGFTLKDAPNYYGHGRHAMLGIKPLRGPQ